jgi:hypothetical protein
MSQQEALNSYAEGLNDERVRAIFTNYIKLSYHNERKDESISSEKKLEEITEALIYFRETMKRFVPSLFELCQNMIRKYRSNFFHVDLFNNLIKPHDEYLKIKYGHEENGHQNPEAHIFTFEKYKGIGKPFRQIVYKFYGDNPETIQFHIIRNQDSKDFTMDVKKLELHPSQYPNVSGMNLEDAENLIKEVALILEGIKEVIDYLTCEHTLVFNSVLLCGDVTGKQIACERIKQVINLTNDAEGNSLLSKPKESHYDFYWCRRGALG